VPKHTVGEQLLDVRRDKKERAAFAMAEGDIPDGGEDDEEAARRFHVELAHPDTEGHDV
jgi:hypothetical protein